MTNPGITQMVGLPSGVVSETNTELPTETTYMEVMDEAVHPHIELDNDMKTKSNRGAITMDDNQTDRNLTALSDVKYNKNNSKRKGKLRLNSCNTQL